MNSCFFRVGIGAATTVPITKFFTSSAPRYLQRTIQPHLEHGAFVENDVAIGEESRQCAGTCSYAGADCCTATAPAYCAAGRAYTGAQRGVFSRAALARALAFDIALFIGRLKPMFSWHSNHGR